MEAAVQAMQNLAQQCSDTSAVKDVVSHLFKILAGEEITNLCYKLLCIHIL